jgi:membrane protein DedA with SNARE-associated domain
MVTTLLLIAIIAVLAWVALSITAGLLVGRSISVADQHERPLTAARTVRVDT